MAVVAQSGTPLDVSYTNNLPATYPDWIPVDTRLTPLGNQVRAMTHLHGGFVAADSDGNPAITPDGFGPGDTQTVHYTNQLPQMPASLLWFVNLTSRPAGDTRMAELFGLSRSESRLLHEFASQEDLTLAAGRLRRSVHTVRNQMKSIRAKTGTRSQSQLLALYARMNAICAR